MQRPQSIMLSTFSLLAAFLVLSENVTAAPLCGLVPPTTTAAVVVPTGTPSGLPASADGTAGDVVASGWYAGWLGATQPPSQISWTKYSAVTFAFACVYHDLGVLHTWNSRDVSFRTTTPDSSQIALDTQSAALLPQFVSAAHDNVRTFSMDFQGGELTWAIFRVLMLYFRSAAGRDLFTTRPQWQPQTTEPRSSRLL